MIWWTLFTLLLVFLVGPILIGAVYVTVTDAWGAWRSMLTKEDIND